MKTSILVGSPPSLGYLPSLPSLESPELSFLNHEEMLRLLCFSLAFCGAFQPFTLCQDFASREKKQVERLWRWVVVGRCTPLLSGILASQVLVALAALNYNFCIPSPMKKALLDFLLLNSNTHPLPRIHKSLKPWLPWQLTNAFI